MRLEDYNGIFFDVKKDCGFESLAKISDQVEKRVISYIEDEKYLSRIGSNKFIVGIICTKDILKDHPELENKLEGIAVSESPKRVFFSLHNYMCDNNEEYTLYGKIETYIDNDAHIASNVSIAETDVYIGKNVRVEENVVIRKGVCIEEGAVIRPGVVLGGTNENDYRDSSGNLVAIRHAGRVKIGKESIIGALSMVAKGIFPHETTVIGDNVHIGYSVGISHHAFIGSHSILLDQSQICGNAYIGEGVQIAPQAIVSNRVAVKDGAVVTIGSVVVNNVKESQQVAGNWAVDKSKFSLWHLSKLRIKNKKE